MLYTIYYIHIPKATDVGYKSFIINKNIVKINIAIFIKLKAFAKSFQLSYNNFQAFILCTEFRLLHISRSREYSTNNMILAEVVDLVFST